MDRGFAITVTHSGSAVNVAVSGELDIATAPALLSRIDREPAPAGGLLLDLTDLTFIDSAGLRALLTTYENHGERLQIIPGAACERVFDVTGVREHLPLVQP